MFESNRTLEDTVITKTTVKEYLDKFDPEIQKIFFNLFGENLDAFPEELLHRERQTEEILQQLLKLGDSTSQKVILMRFGLVTGTPMTEEEVSKKLGITRERIRQIESKFLRKPRHLTRRKKLVDYLND